MSIDTTIFWGIFAISLAFFAWSCFQRFRLVTLGNSENRSDHAGRRFLSMLVHPFAQRCAITRRYFFGINHAILFWCFMVLFIANSEFLLHGIVPDYVSLSNLPTGLYHFFAFAFDLVSILALIAVAIAAIRRLAFPPWYIAARSRDAFTILGLVAILMIAYFGLHGSEIAGGIETAAPYMPVSNFAASAFLSGVTAESLPAYTKVFWWVHAVVLLGFLNYLPYSKHMHILAAIPNCFFRSLDRVTTLPREDFKPGETFGVGSVEGFTWKGLFDSYSCTECGRCSSVCPATNTGKPLDPRLVIHDIKVNLLKNGPLLVKGESPVLPLIGEEQEGSVAEEVLWECTTCGACMEVCPVFIEHVPRIGEMRRDLVEMRARFPHELLALFENMEQRSNPWGIAPGDRAKWASETMVQPFEAGKTEYLLYVGCAGAFDARSRQVTLATSKVLNAAGVSFGILGKEEYCCGDSLRRLGNEFVFDRMAEANVKQFQDKGVKKIITQCPHCYSTFKNDYRQYGLEAEIVHHSSFINQLIQQNKLRLNRNKVPEKVVFHDSCYLGRHNGIYTPPREVISAATGSIPSEMTRRGENSFCCGAGGGRMWMEEKIGKRINLERTEEALKMNPNTICVSCPYCMTMFEDGLKDTKVDDRVKVLDVAEVVAGALE